ncbi:hypothetical protein [Piscinibacter sakaiensis]|uniref:Uncharacterized protein n=1 Tax=Piscinibacter sakaiensis TaxID=1547922 RepID=A0A0K8P845_PISS1|nr:hypothetical protein [Piscinibacter sakaiensis]GAP38807.1 hypothetical protein ISF6_5360 [Piscinibacter sakaiensis]
MAPAPAPAAIGPARPAAGLVAAQALRVEAPPSSLADLAAALRREPGRWTVQRGDEAPRGGAAAVAAADWLERLQAATADAQRAQAAQAGHAAAAASPGPGATLASPPPPASLTLRRDGALRHRFVLEDGRWRWEGPARPAGLAGGPLDAEAAARLVDGRP